MCGDCWNAAMAAPTAAVAARFAWIGYRDRLPFRRNRGPAEEAPAEGEPADADELVDTGVP
ncbi:MAG TPA: hypothetical protein VFU19_21320 [Iamia sp.]|nr:hypothetical protein [Iamia sp.]